MLSSSYRDGENKPATSMQTLLACAWAFWRSLAAPSAFFFTMASSGEQKEADKSRY
jgi:hypothetical protein